MRIAPPIAIGPLSAGDLSGVQQLLKDVTESDGVAPLSSDAIANLTADEPSLTHAVAHDKYGKVTGYLQVDRSGPQANAQIVVHPQYRRRGIGRMLATVAAHDATLPQVAGQQGAPGKPLLLWAPSGRADSEAFADSLGYRADRSVGQPGIDVYRRSPTL